MFLPQMVQLLSQMLSLAATRLLAFSQHVSWFRRGHPQLYLLMLDHLGLHLTGSTAVSLSVSRA